MVFNNEWPYRPVGRTGGQWWSMLEQEVTLSP